jgi:hypothetical protein
MEIELEKFRPRESRWKKQFGFYKNKEPGPGGSHL